MSSNDRGDEPRVTPSASSRERPNRPTATAQRVDNDPRADASRPRPDSSGRNGSNGNGNGSTRPPDNVVAIDSTGTAPKRPSRRAKPHGPHSQHPVIEATAAPAAEPAVADAPQARSVAPDDLADGTATSSPITGPIAMPPATPPSQVTSPVTSPFVAVPIVAAPPSAPAVLPPPGPPPPAALAPAPMPLPPSVFDDEEHPTGAIPFDALFDPEADASGIPRRQRAVQFTQTGRRSRPRLRRVTRVVRHVDPWSVFKVALCFSLVLYGVCLTAGVLLWNVAYTTGTIDNVQRFFESFGWDTFRFKGGELFHNAWIAGLFGALGLTGLIVLAVTLFNLITDLVGGIRVTVLEEEVVERNPTVRGPLLRRRTRPVSMITPDRGFDDPDSPDSTAHLG